MRPADLARLALLGAIWGGSFIFIRVTAPALGPLWMAEGRVLLGGLALLAWFAITRFDPQWRTHWRFYALIGVVNSAIPFTLYGYAGLHLGASTMAFVNATSPMFGLLLGTAFGAERITRRKVAGLVIGAVGVAFVARPDSGGTLLAIAACLCASFAYGLTGLLLKRYGAGVPSRGVAVGSQFAAAAVLLPFLPFSVPASPPDAIVVFNLILLGVLASGFAFILYFRLMVDVGATRALTVTFLVPLFAFAWAAIFLGEALTAPIAIGGVLILAGTLLVTRG
ncbi:MAG TPA: DMT family transporter [Burkholderiales bacterium]|nr:DMT family transporter [Burkholderiales bacterium]